MKNLFALAASSLLVGGGIGYIAGNQASDEGSGENRASTSDEGLLISSSRRARGNDEGLGNESGFGADRPRSLQDVVNTPGQTARLQALVDLYSGLSPEEFPGEADKLNDLPFNERILNAYVLFAAWAEVAPYEAFEHANTKMGRTGMFVRPTILQSWAASDPKAAADYYQANRSDFVMMDMMGRGREGGASGAATIAGEWARQDPEGALAWAKSLPEGERDDASIKAIAQIASSDPEKAAGLTAGLEGRSLTEARQMIAAEWARIDWDRAENFINILPASQRAEAMGAAVGALAGDDPVLAASKALGIPEGPARNGAISAVAESMAREQPAEAARWVSANGDEETQRQAVGNIMSNWVNQDPSAAKDWAVSRPAGPVRDAAVASYVINDSKGSPPENIQLAESISDERSRGWAVGMATMRWMGEDREAAIDFVQSSDLIDERMRERILRRNGQDAPPQSGTGQ